MPGTTLFLAGDSDGVEALRSALSEQGIEARSAAVSDMATSLVELEQTLQDDRPNAAVVAGDGEPALVLGITASKLGIPLIACLGEAGESADGAKHRILSTLATLEAGADPQRAADVIVAWLHADAPTQNAAGR